MTVTFRVEDEAVHYARAERRRRKHEHALEENARDREFLLPRGREPSEIWAAVEDWNRGVMPANDALVRLLAMFEDGAESLARNVSAPATREAVQAVAKTAGLWQRAVRERNADGLLQRFAAHLRMALRNAAAEATMARSGRLRLDEHLSLLGRQDWAVEDLEGRLGHALRAATADARALVLVAQLLLTSAPFVAHVTAATNILERLFGADDAERRAPIAKGQATVEVFAPGADHAAQPLARGILEDARPLFEAMHKTPAHRDALNAVLDVARRTHETAEAAQSLAAALPTAGLYDANIAAARNDLVQVAARFAGGHSPARALEATRALLATAPSPAHVAGRLEERHGGLSDGGVSDRGVSNGEAGSVADELADLIADAGAFLSRCVADGAFVASEEYTRRGTRLVERATRGRAADALRKRTQDAVAAWRAYVAAWLNDPLTSALAAEAGRLAGALPALAASGAARADIRDVLLPAALALAHSVPLPHVEAGDPRRGVRIALDGIHVPVPLLTPRAASLRTTGTLRARGASPGGGRRPGARDTRLRPGTPGVWRTGFHVRLSGMAGSIAPVRFTLARRTFPRIRDRGRVDVRICGRRGLSIATDVDTGDVSGAAPTPGASLIVPRRVAVKISRVRLRFHGVRHRLLFAAARPIIEGRVRKSLEHAICDRVVASVRVADGLARMLISGVASA